MSDGTDDPLDQIEWGLHWIRSGIREMAGEGIEKALYLTLVKQGFTESQALTVVASFIDIKIAHRRRPPCPPRPAGAL